MKVCMVLTFAAILLVGCGGSKTVTRLDSETVTDLSGRWNDTDARLVAEEMIRDCLSRRWLTEFAAASGRKPVVTVGTIRNRTNEHIDTETFTSDFERELLNSGQVRFVAAKEQREDLYEELAQQQEFASSKTMKRFKEATGADFVLLGSIKSITDQEEGLKAVFYQTDLELINVETWEKVWIGDKKIKKGISRGSRKW
ncbi:MAG: penicillin-binding protein activator LpoB [Candidatus Zixiibacteriota bacterium]